MDLIVETLRGAHVTLEPLNEGHKEDLRRVAADQTIWTYIASDATGEHFDPWFSTARELTDNTKEIVFAVRRTKEGDLVGSTRYMNLAPDHDCLEIGHTYYAPAVWGTKVNPGAKLLLLNQAFEVMGCNRVELRCDALNARSRAAIEKLGARLEGILHENMLMPSGRRRDTAVHAILKSDWLQVRAGLEARLSA